MSIGQDWWRWDGTQWVALRTGTAVVPTDPDDPSGRDVLLVADRTGNVQAIRTVLETDGWAVTVRQLSEPEDYDGFNVVILFTGNPTSGDNGRYLYPPLGVVAVDSWRSVGMSNDLGFAATPPDLQVVDTSSPLAAGFSGTYPAYVSEQFVTWKPDDDLDADTVVTRAGQPSQRVIVSWDAGSNMPGRYVTTRHVGLGFHADGFVAGLSSVSRAQFLAAVRWARDTNVVGLPVPDAPTGLAATVANGQVRLSWSAPAFAETYVVRRATVTGGPYTNVGTQVSTTAFTDTTVTNDVEYFYVVAAKNFSGEGPNSAEVSATPTSTASESLAMLASSDELAMWQSRAANGPFRVAGDFSTNSPGEWSEMQAAMSLAPFQSARWDGPTILTSFGAVAHLGNGGGRDNDPPSNVRVMANEMMSAAYAAIVTGNNSVAQAITAEIAWQAQRPRLDFGNRTLYPYDYMNDLNPLFRMASWIQGYILAYDITRAMGFSSATVERWFDDFADLLEDELHNGLNGIWPNRKSNVWNPSTSHWSHEVRQGPRLANGTVVTYRRGMWVYNNRRNHMAGTLGMIGALLNNSFYMGEFNRYSKEFLMFGHRNTASDGFHGDINRGTSTNPQLGISYSFRGINSMAFGMDAVARTGDTTAYDYSSSNGYITDGNAVGTNQSKTMEDVFDSYIKWIAGTWPAHYAGGNPPSSSVAGDEFYRIKSRSSNTNREMCHESALLLPANYFNRSDWQDVVLRVGTPSGFTSSPHTVSSLSGWRSGFRQRGLRDVSTNPY